MMIRITVKLGHYFDDHRSIARILLDQKIKTVQDVAKRISNIFEIQDFYLSCDNHYLPFSESVEILSYDDVVWAIPINSHKIRIFDEDPSRNSETNEEFVRKKKKKKSKEKEESELESCNVKSRKRYHNSEEETEPKKKKKKRSSKNVNAKKQNDSGDSGCDSQNGSKDKLESECEHRNMHVKSIVDSFENKKFNYKEKLQKMIHPNQFYDKKINIVKTVVLSSNNSTPASNNKITSLSEENENVEKDDSPTQSVTSIDLNICEKSSITNNSSLGDCSDVSKIDSFCGQKRKRKRVRKRKSKVDEKEDPMKFCPVKAYQLIPRPLLGQAKSGIHVRFEDVPPVSDHIENTESNENETPGSTCPLLEQPKSGIHVRFDEPCNHEITDHVKNADGNKIDNNCNGDIRSARFESETPVTAVDSVKILENNDIKKFNIDVRSELKNDSITEAFIMKQPITASTEPRIGDIIAFKILRISESYTPEISSNIVGKVTNYNKDSKEILFNIIYGCDQCSQPQGKFFIDQEEQESPKITKQQFLWSNLIEPRLLYP